MSDTDFYYCPFCPTIHTRYWLGKHIRATHPESYSLVKLRFKSNAKIVPEKVNSEDYPDARPRVMVRK